MKKWLIFLATLTLFVLAMPVLANAATSQETEICNKVKEKEKIKEAQCVVFKNNCILAIETEKFATKSEYDVFKMQLQKEVTEQFGLERVLITRSPKAMHTIAKLASMTENEREKAIEEFVENEFHNHKPHRPFIPELH